MVNTCIYRHLADAIHRFGLSWRDDVCPMIVDGATEFSGRAGKGMAAPPAASGEAASAAAATQRDRFLQRSVRPRGLVSRGGTRRATAGPPSPKISAWGCGP